MVNQHAGNRRNGMCIFAQTDCFCTATGFKQWVAELLDRGTPPDAITYLTGELIDDHHSLLLHLLTHLDDAPIAGINTLIIDEVTYIRDWDKAIKFAADAGLLERTVVVVTGSDLVFMQEARMRFPGRRGPAAVADFHLHPLSFKEFLRLEGTIEHLDELADRSAESIEARVMDRLYSMFDRYLLHGGYLTAINDLAILGEIRRSTLATYSDWIRGDVLKRGRQEAHLREILSAVIKRYGSQITWNAMAQDLSIDHPKTVADYVALLERMDALCVIPALREEQLAAAPKKARKLAFCDPFILHALRAWLQPTDDPFNAQIRSAAADPVGASRLVEACVATHCRRAHPTFYIKARGRGGCRLRARASVLAGGGQVDESTATQDGDADRSLRREPTVRVWSFATRNSAPIQRDGFRNVSEPAHGNGEIWSKSRSFGEINGVKVAPLPLRLLRF